MYVSVYSIHMQNYIRSVFEKYAVTVEIISSELKKCVFLVQRFESYLRFNNFLSLYGIGC